MKKNLKALMATIGMLLAFFGIVYLMISFPKVSFPIAFIIMIGSLSVLLFKNFQNSFEDNEK
jgi:hypothetical protein